MTYGLNELHFAVKFIVTQMAHIRCQVNQKKYLVICVLSVVMVVILCSANITPSTVSNVLAGYIPVNTFNSEKRELIDSSAGITLDLWSRKDVQTHTSWGAPIMWDGMFQAEQQDHMHKMNGSSVALTVFAVGRYLDAYLVKFLVSAELHFMVGLPVKYYVYTDRPDKVPVLPLGPERSMKVLQVAGHSRWQDISMTRMKTIAEAIASDIRHHSSHVFCMDVDQAFTGRFGSEALGDSVALLHAYFYRLPKVSYTYDKNPKSAAYMATGDFYYHAAVFGGSCASVQAAAEACYRAILLDKGNGVEALWHDESHLNKYFWLHKPTKVLSPEYCWDPLIGQPKDIRVVRLIWAPKRYKDLRLND